MEDIQVSFSAQTDAIICADSLELMPTLPDSSIDLMINDPPYFKIKNEWWDRQWDTVDGYLEWLDKLCQQWHRLLKPNGSLYVFASPKMAARVEVKIGEWFNVLNRIRWMKEEGWHKKAVPESLRGYLSPWEEIIFAEHYGADNAAKGESEYGAKCDELRGFVFEPLRAYFRGEMLRAGLSYDEINEGLGTARNGSGMAGHYFKPIGCVQWSLPIKERYLSLQKIFSHQGRRPAPPYEDYHDAPRTHFEKDHSEHEYLRAEYEDLRAEYEDLRAEYEDLRRPFSVTAQDQYTDVWEFPTVKTYPGKHLCEKPLELISHIIKVSSREGALVADFFCGSGVTAEAAMKMNRHYLCCDVEQKWADFSRERVEKAKLVQMEMFNGSSG